MIPRLPLALGLLALALAVLAPFMVATAQAPTVTPTIAPTLELTPFICIDDAGELKFCPTLAPTPFPTWTPERTPTIEPTHTPSPSSTPTSTATTTATATVTPTATTPPSDTPEPSPTPELTPPPPTFTVTPPVTKVCTLRANGFNINAREDPSVTASVTGLWGAGEEAVMGAFSTGQGYLWGYHDLGWSVVAVYTPGDDEATWWVAGTQAATLCTLVEGWPDGLQPPAPIARNILQGAHIIGSDAANMLLGYCNAMSTVKLFETVIHYADDFRACNPDIWIVCRYWTDDIAIDTDYNAQESYNRIGNSFPDDCDAVEWENEKAPNNHRDWERWSAYSIDAARLMAENRNMQYCAMSWGPGWVEFDKLQYVIEYLKWVDANPLPDGRYHCMASHAAMFAPWDRADMPWVNDPYIAGRVYLIRDWIMAITPDDFDLYEWRGVWAITEIGLSDGYSGNWSAPYTCDELAQAHWETNRVYVEHGIPHAQHDWNYGRGGIWTDDSACARQVWG